jgi:hypothetical protein
VQGEESADKFLPRLEAAFAAPVFYPSRAPAFAPTVAEALPGRLPPLRGDAPTLVAGLLKPGATSVGLTVEGTVAGRKMTVEVNEAIPAADVTNYFLVGLLHQWRNADRTAPALVRADRTLASAYEQTRLAREDLLTQAYWGLEKNHLDAAAKLFEAARKLDPRDPEPAAGLRIVAKLKDGQITREQIRKQLSDPSQIGVRIGQGGMTRGQMAQLAEEQPPPPAGIPGGPPQPVPGGPPPAGIPANPPVPGITGAPPQGDSMELERRRRQVQEQQVTQVVNDTIARARQLINGDPDAAYELLKRQLSAVRENTDLSDKVRATLAGQMESALRWVVAEGALVKQRQENCSGASPSRPGARPRLLAAPTRRRSASASAPSAP